MWKGTRINIVDTPGHADFGGEVERILSMVDGVLVLVDAAEGPMPQTKFVTVQGAAPGPAADRASSTRSTAPTRAPTEVHNEIFDLFAALDADEEQLDFPTLYASGRAGWAVADLADARDGSHAAVRSHRRAREAALRRCTTRRSPCWRRRSNTTPISAAC